MQPNVSLHTIHLCRFELLPSERKATYARVGNRCDRDSLISHQDWGLPCPISNGDRPRECRAGDEHVCAHHCSNEPGCDAFKLYEPDSDRDLNAGGCRLYHGCSMVFADNWYDDFDIHDVYACVSDCPRTTNPYYLVQTTGDIYDAERYCANAPLKRYDMKDWDCDMDEETGDPGMTECTDRCYEKCERFNGCKFFAVSDERYCELHSYCDDFASLEVEIPRPRQIQGYMRCVQLQRPDARHQQPSASGIQRHRLPEGWTEGDRAESEGIGGCVQGWANYAREGVRKGRMEGCVGPGRAHRTEEESYGSGQASQAEVAPSVLR